MNSSAPSVNTLCPRAVLQAAAAVGVDDKALLRDAGISAELLQLRGEQVSLGNYLQLYALAVERSGDPDLGLYVGHIMYFSGMNLHLYMTTICRNLKEYFNLIPSTLRLHGDTGRVLIRPEGESIRLEWHPLDDRTGSWRPLADEMLKLSADIEQLKVSQKALSESVHRSQKNPKLVSALGELDSVLNGKESQSKSLSADMVRMKNQLNQAQQFLATCDSRTKELQQTVSLRESEVTKTKDLQSGQQKILDQIQVEVAANEKQIVQWKQTYEKLLNQEKELRKH